MTTTSAPITFAAYMEQALYGLEGYYASGRAKSGRVGDYFTAPDVGPLFGQLLAVQFLDWQKRLDVSPFHLIEAGAGEGTLAKDILQALERHQGHLPSKGGGNNFHYIAMERSPARRQILREIPGLQITPDLESWPGPPMRGCLFANELIDAFPVHRVCWTGGCFQEGYIENGKTAWGTPSTPKLRAYFERLGIELPEGYHTEVNLAMSDWVQGVSSAFSKGLVLIIDYGRPAWAYYAPERDRGTLRGFRGHHLHSVIPAPSEPIDLTADVDFTSLALDAQEAGFTPLAFMELGSFLMPAVQTLDLKGFPPAALQYLLHPEGMGSAFHVLILGKGIALDALEFQNNRLSRLRLGR